MENYQKLQRQLSKNLSLLQALIGITVALIPVFGLYFVVHNYWPEDTEVPSSNVVKVDTLVKPATAPSEWRMHKEEDAELIAYGKQLIANTAYYLGPKGTVKPITNGLNCQNCHLEAGTKPFGNNYLSVASTYPKFRKRSGKITSITDRINGCLQRSLNGKPMDSTDHEMLAMAAYIKWVGSDTPKGETAYGSLVYKIPYLDRAADPVAGEAIYTAKCVSCHQADGQGLAAADGRTYTYPPLWGSHSYNDGAGLFRMSKLAGYVKMNMPFGASYENPQLTDEESWDVAAYINSKQRPEKDKSKDWPKLADKPIDHPFGPYADPFSENQHKYGPFKPIEDWYKKNM